MLILHVNLWWWPSSWNGGGGWKTDSGLMMADSDAEFRRTRWRADVQNERIPNRIVCKQFVRNWMAKPLVTFWSMMKAKREDFHSHRWLRNEMRFSGAFFFFRISGFDVRWIWRIGVWFWKLAFAGITALCLDGNVPILIFVSRHVDIKRRQSHSTFLSFSD